MAITTDGRPVKVEEHSTDAAATSSSSSTSYRRQSQSSRSFSSWAVSNLARIAVWYTLITIIFRCPSSTNDLSETSPQICKPYITTRNHIQPYVQPYYDKYADPYVEVIRPYADQLNSRVVQPGSVIVATNYKKYAAPQIEKAKHYAYLQWEKAVLPEVLRAQQQAYKIYDTSLAPHVDKASAAASPYYEAARDNALDVHSKHILPMITSSKPHLYTAYATVHNFVLDTGLPLVQHLGSHIIIFVDGTLWPFIKTVYSDNVKPQLVMISERIAKYQEGRKLQSAMNEAEVSVDATSMEALSSSEAFTQSTIPTSEAAASVSPTSIITESASSSTAPTESERPTVATDESVSADLEKWQKKFAVAADKGGEDLSERVEDILNDLRKSGISEGEGLSTALEKTAEVELDSIKTKIKTLVKALPEDAATTEVEAAEAEIVQAIRASGQKVKGRATNVRNWAGKFNKELHQRTELAADSTLQVLDGIRDLGLQEIGMRWAWMEGVTYKHWQKYHDLKQKFEDWRTKVKDVALNHPLLKESEEAAEQLLEESMAVTEQTAIELIRLKEVAKWKLRARDDTDDFESRAIPAAAVSAASSLAAELKDVTSSILGETSTGQFESLSAAASSGISEAASSVSSYVAGSTGVAESIMSEASSSASEAAESASSAILGTSTGSAESLASAIASSGSKAAQVVADSAESLKSVADDAATVAASFTSSIANAASEGTDQLSKSIYMPVISDSVPPSEGLYETATSVVDQVSESASSVFSDVKDASYSASVRSIIDIAEDKAEEATSSLSSVVA